MESMKQRLYRKANRILGLKSRGYWENGTYIGRRCKAVVQQDAQEIADHGRRLQLTLVRGGNYQEVSAYDIDKAMKDVENSRNKRDLLDTRDIV